MNRNAVRKNRLTSYETSIVNHSVEWLEHSESGEDVWKHYGTIARIMELEGETQVLIIRTSDAKHEYQPLQDVIEGDTIRLGKEIGNSFRGRKTSRGNMYIGDMHQAESERVGATHCCSKEKHLREATSRPNRVLRVNMKVLPCNPL